MKRIYTLAALVATTVAANAVIITTKDVTNFTNHYLGSDVYDGASYQAPWSANTIGSQSLSGDSLTVSPNANGWLEQDTGSSDWENIGDNSWTFEVTLTLGAEATGVALWADPAAANAGTIVFVGSTTGTGDDDVTNGSNGSYDATPNVGTHTFRMAYDQPAGLISLWRDGALLANDIAPSNPGGGPRLIIGDCCSDLGAGNSFVLESASYDTTGAFAPVPEPSSAALLGLGGLALILRRRK